MTNAVMKASLLNAWTDGLRGAFAGTMMQNFAKKLGTAWKDLDGWDKLLMERKGITEADWDIITKAEPTERNGVKYLTADGIRNLSEADVTAARPDAMQRITDRIKEQTKELEARNQQDQNWISGRIDKFDDARDTLNRWVKERQKKRLSKNEEGTEPMLQRMALLSARLEQAKLESSIEAQLNKLVTQSEIRGFLNAVEDGASADLTASGPASKEIRSSLSVAESLGRNLGKQKASLERQMREAENKIAQMDREANKAANADAKKAIKKSDEMAKDLAQFIERSKERQATRSAIIQRLSQEEAPRLAAEADRLRADAATKWIAFVNDEAQFAVVNPDLAARGIVTGGGMKAGTPSGEVVRSMAQFKSFPISMVTRHWRRILDTPQGIDGAPMGFAGQSGAQELAGRIGALAALMVTATLLGAIQTQGRHVMVGKDPVDMTGEHAAKFWAKAFAAGGGSGFFGDVLLAPLDDPSMSFEGKFGLLGPVAGAAAGVIDIAKSNEPDARAVKWVNDQLPGVDIWYLRGLWEHAVLHNAQEAANPGYLARMQRRAQKDWGQDFWWTPGELTPDRAPDFGAAVEEMAR
jgi:hypothetical protein